MLHHHDVLEGLNEHIPVRDKLIATHKSAIELFPFIDRIAVALYNSKIQTLATFLHSSEDQHSQDHYQALIDNAPVLKEIMQQKLPRIIKERNSHANHGSDSNNKIGRKGYAASYTMPMFNDGECIGLIFFNSHQTGVFTENVLHQLDIYGHLIALMVVKELISTQMLLAAVKTTGHITHVRDPETGSHLDRMARYSRLIANEPAKGLISKPGATKKRLKR